MTIQPPGKAPMDFEPVLLVVKESEVLRWPGRVLLPKLFDGEHYFIINETSKGNTQLVQRTPSAGQSAAHFVRYLGVLNVYLLV